MNKENFDNKVKTAIGEIEKYWAHSTSLGDWRRMGETTPIMTSLVTRYYNVKASKPDKMSYFTDIMMSMSDNNRLHGIATDAMRSLPPEGVNAVKILVNDTINIHSDTSMAFVNNELRREFMEAQYKVTGTVVPENEFIQELSMDGFTSDNIATVLASLEIMPILSSALNGCKESVIGALPQLLALAQSMAGENPRLAIAVRQMAGIVEAAGVLKSILAPLVEAAQTLGNGVASGKQGVKIGMDISEENKDESLAEINGKLTQVTQVLSGYSQPAGNNVFNALTTSARAGELDDMIGIINMSQVPIKYPEKYLIALSTAYGLTTVPQSISNQPRNNTVALFYLSKIIADSRCGGNADSSMVANVASELIHDKVESGQNVRIGLVEAIQYDMTAKNGNATLSLAKLMGARELATFAQTFLANNNGITPILTVDSLMSYIKSVVSSNASRVTVSDVEGFLMNNGYVALKNAVPAFKNDLVQSIVKAITTLQ